MIPREQLLKLLKDHAGYSWEDIADAIIEADGQINSIRQVVRLADQARKDVDEKHQRELNEIQLNLAKHQDECPHNWKVHVYPDGGQSSLSSECTICGKIE